MTQTEPGILRASLHFVQKALNENALLRTSVLVTVLGITLACILLAFFGVTHSISPKEAANAYSPRLFGLLFLPAEFFIYDLILGNREPRATIKELYLDWRLPRLVWAAIQTFLAVVLPAGAAMLLLVGLTAGFATGAKPGLFAGLTLVVGILVLTCAMLYSLSRFFYLPLVVARREAQPVRTAFRETKGKLWRIGCVLFLPYLAIIAVTVPVELLGPMLEHRLGFVGLAPWFLLDAGLTGFLSCLSAAVLAFSYQRIVTPGAAEPSGVEPAPGSPQGPQASGTGEPGWK